MNTLYLTIGTIIASIVLGFSISSLVYNIGQRNYANEYVVLDYVLQGTVVSTNPSRNNLVIQSRNPNSKASLTTFSISIEETTDLEIQEFVKRNNIVETILVRGGAKDNLFTGQYVTVLVTADIAGLHAKKIITEKPL